MAAQCPTLRRMGVRWDCGAAARSVCCPGKRKAVLGRGWRASTSNAPGTRRAELLPEHARHARGGHRRSRRDHFPDMTTTASPGGQHHLRRILHLDGLRMQRVGSDSMPNCDPSSKGINKLNIERSPTGWFHTPPFPGRRRPASICSQLYIDHAQLLHHVPLRAAESEVRGTPRQSPPGCPQDFVARIGNEEVAEVFRSHIADVPWGIHHGRKAVRDRFGGTRDSSTSSFA